MNNIIDEFIQKESSSGVLLIFVTILALILSNTAIAPLYQSLIHIPIEVRIGSMMVLWLFSSY
jgi:NhaA family Na+:H+ antiporter